jgi:hypothetical protein
VTAVSKVIPLKVALRPNLAEAQRFIAHMSGSADALITLQTFDDSKGERGHLARILHGTIDQHVEELSRLQREGAGVYWMVNIGDGNGRCEENVTAVRCLFADLDGTPLEPIVNALKPHAIIESSPGRWHVYYLVADCPKHRFKSLQSAIARRFGSDPSVCDLPRVMRMPGFSHMKGDPFISQIIELNNRDAYFLAEIEFDLLGGDVPNEVRNNAQPANLADATDALAYLPPQPLEDIPENRKRLAGALSALSADCDRDTWRNIVFSILSTHLPDSAEIAREWSKTAPNRYDEHAFDSLVKSYKDERRHGGNLIGPGTLFHLAKEAGWIDSPNGDADDLNADTTFRLIPAHKFVHAGPVSWLVRNLIQREGLGVIYGESGSGKSFFVLDLSGAIARGTSWRGLAVTSGPVVYIAAEGAGGFRKRLQAFAQHHGIKLRELPFLVLGDAPNLLRDDDRPLSRAIQSAGGAVLIVVDTLAMVTPGGNENSGEDMGAVINRCKRLQAETGAFVLLVHHSGKDASRGARGWSGIRAAVDLEIEITRNGDDRTARVTKQKDGEDGSIFPFRLEVIDLGADAEGNPSTSCVVEHLDSAPPSIRREPKGTVQKTVFQVIKEFGPCTVDTLLKTAVERMIHDPEKKDKRREHVKRALDTLLTTKALMQDLNKEIRLYGDTLPEWGVSADGEGEAFEEGL